MGAEVVPTGAVASGSESTSDKAEAQTSVQPQTPTQSPRAAKVAAFRAAAAKGAQEAPAASSQTPTAPAVPVEGGKPAEVAAKPEEPPADSHTAKALEAIEKRDKRAREQLAADIKSAKAELEAERAEIARLRAEISGKSSSFDDLKKLPPARRYLEALKAVEINPDDEETMEVVARDSYARSKSGKADPKNKAYAEQVAEKRGLETELAELRKMVEETRNEFSTRDQKAEAERFQQTYLDEAVKAIPTDPTFIGRAHAAAPARARAELLAIGQRLERDNGETPTHAEVIAEYERLAKADLVERGFTDAQIAAMLTKPAATIEAPAKPAPSRTTIDPAHGSVTTPINGTPSREQKIAAARMGLQRRQASS